MDLAVIPNAIGRGVVAGVCVLAHLGWVPTAAQAEPAIRQSWQAFSQDPQKVQSLRDAVARMKSLNASDPKGVAYRQSWTYWANIHGYFGPESPFGTVAQNTQSLPEREAAYFKGIVDMTPPDDVARQVWAQCQHGTPWFFAWHRLYLFYFEKQLQLASGNPDLRLPYWDYTNPAQLKMPPEFTQPTYVDAGGKVQSNPLYEPRRAPGWANANHALKSQSTDIDSALSEHEQFEDYQDDIENGVHGYIHCSVAVNCPVADMGAVPYSSNDPIFWIHHANIDRLWSCWRQMPGHQNPMDDAFVNQPFTFVDASGMAVTNLVGDLFKGQLIDYQYEQEMACARSPALTVAKPAAPGAAPAKTATTRNLLRMSEPLSITQNDTTVKLTPSADAMNGGQIETGGLSLAVKPGRARLVLRGIRFEDHPGTMFHIYLKPSGAETPKVHVGTLSFFVLPRAVSAANAANAASGSHEHAHPSKPMNRTFDVTQALQQFAAQQQDQISVVIEAGNGREGDTSPAVRNENARMQIKSIELMR
ncbi:MAG: hypothetical protein RLZZ123_2828 [Pseudomonadota bacterium]|jgi:hypothetical protein